MSTSRNLKVGSKGSMTEPWWGVVGWKQLESHLTFSQSYGILVIVKEVQVGLLHAGRPDQVVYT